AGRRRRARGAETRGARRRPRGGRAGRADLDRRRFRRQRLGAPRHAAAHAGLAAPVRLLRIDRRRCGADPAGRGPGGARRLLRRALLPDHPRPVRRQRALPPAALVTARLDGHEAARPLDDLPLHRRDVHAVRPPGRLAADRFLGSLRRLGGRARRRHAQAVVAGGAPLGGRPALHRTGLGRRLRAHRHPAHRGGRLDGPAGRRRSALHGRRRRLRDQEAQPVAGHLRVPRGVPRDDHRGRDLPLHRRLLRHVQQPLRL
ncbi:MAG: FIG01964566: Predicted membrane protein, hemolysin III homolog, partial [uncultured Blastococcus sp.]